MRFVSILAALCLISAPGAAQHDHAQPDDSATTHHRFGGAEAWAERFEDPKRDEWQRPDRVIAALVHRDDLVVADIGSATGYFPVRFARAVPRGRVIGADIEPDMVRFLNDRARSEGIPNLVGVLAAPDDPHLPVAADLVFLCNTYHHIDGRVDYFRRLKQQLAPDGRIAVIDFRPSSSRGPDYKLPADAVKREMVEAGFEITAEHDFLPDQYLLVFTPAD